MLGPNLDLTEEHKLIRDTARNFAQNEIAPIAAHFDETGEFPYETIKKMGALGYDGGTAIKAGLIGEIGISWPMHPDERKALRGAVIAQKKTGAPLSVHPGRMNNTPVLRYWTSCRKPAQI